MVTAHGQALSSSLTYSLSRVFSLVISAPMWGAYWFICGVMHHLGTCPRDYGCSPPLKTFVNCRHIADNVIQDVMLVSFRDVMTSLLAHMGQSRDCKMYKRPCAKVQGITLLGLTLCFTSQHTSEALGTAS